MKLKDYTQSVAQKDTSLADLAEDVLRDNRIDWNKEDLEILTQIRGYISIGQVSRTFKKFTEDYFKQIEIDDDDFIASSRFSD